MQKSNIYLILVLALASFITGTIKAQENINGITRMGTEKRVTSETLFEAASVTKMATAIVAFGHGALVTTPSDLARLVKELMLSYMGKSDRILSRESSRKLIDNKISLDPAVLGGIEAGQGYGLLVKGDAGNICFLMAGQNFPGATCIVVGFPNTGQGAVVMTNSEMGELVHIEVVSSIGKVFDWPSSKVF